MKCWWVGCLKAKPTLTVTLSQSSAQVGDVCPAQCFQYQRLAVMVYEVTGTFRNQTKVINAREENSFKWDLVNQPPDLKGSLCTTITRLCLSHHCWFMFTGNSTFVDQVPDWNLCLVWSHRVRLSNSKVCFIILGGVREIMTCWPLSASFTIPEVLIKASTSSASTRPNSFWSWWNPCDAGARTDSPLGKCVHEVSLRDVIVWNWPCNYQGCRIKAKCTTITTTRRLRGRIIDMCQWISENNLIWYSEISSVTGRV